jgi:hypothetical protein
MQNQPVQPVKQTAEYLQLTPILEAIRTNNDKRPSNTLPINTNGTVQQNNSSLLPPVTLYNAHGIVRKENPNSLIAYA